MVKIIAFHLLGPLILLSAGIAIAGLRAGLAEAKSIPGYNSGPYPWLIGSVTAVLAVFGIGATAHSLGLVDFWGSL